MRARRTPEREESSRAVLKDGLERGVIASGSERSEDKRGDPPVDKELVPPAARLSAPRTSTQRRRNGQRPLGQDQRPHPTASPLILASDLAHSACSAHLSIRTQRPPVRLSVCPCPPVRLAGEEGSRWLIFTSNRFSSRAKTHTPLWST